MVTKRLSTRNPIGPEVALLQCARQQHYITLIELRQDDQIAKITGWREFYKNNTPIRKKKASAKKKSRCRH